MINHQLTTTQWLALPIEVRNKLKEVFGIPRSEGAFVQDNKVLSDGHNHRDLSVITMEKMQAYLGVGAMPTDTFYGLFDQVIEKVDAENYIEIEHAHQAINKSDVVVSKPIEELFIEHNGKTYKLIEVVPTTNAQVDAHTFPPVAQVPAAPTKAPTTRAKRGPNKPKAK